MWTFTPEDMDFPMTFPWYIPLYPIKPPFSYGFPMVFLWFSHGNSHYIQINHYIQGIYTYHRNRSRTGWLGSSPEEKASKIQVVKNSLWLVVYQPTQYMEYILLIYGWYMVNIWLLYGYYMVIIWLMMVNDYMVGGRPTPLKNHGVRQLGWWHFHIWSGKNVLNHQPDYDWSTKKPTTPVSDSSLSWCVYNSNFTNWFMEDISTNLRTGL